MRHAAQAAARRAHPRPFKKVRRCVPASERAPAQSLHSPSGAGSLSGRQDAGAAAGTEPASGPEPLPAAGRAAPEHCCRGGRSSGYWVPALTFQFFFTAVIYRLGRQAIEGHKLLSQTLAASFVVSSLSFQVALCLAFLRRVRDLNSFASSNFYYVYSKT
jgi:hypothetical protein